MDKPEQFSIRELAQKADVTARTIRYYTTEGLLPPPNTNGRYALYTHEHVQRLQLIARLKEAYLPLNEIKAQMEQLTSKQVQQLLAEYDQHTAPPPASATEYIAQVLATQNQPTNQPTMTHRKSFGYQDRASNRHPPSREFVDLSRQPEFARGQADAMEATPASVSPARSLAPQPYNYPSLRETRDAVYGTSEEHWRRVVLAPGVELHVREPLSSDMSEQAAQLLAFARDLFRDEQ